MIKAKFGETKEYSEIFVIFLGGKIGPSKRRKILNQLRKERDVVEFAQINIFAKAMNVTCKSSREFVAKKVIGMVLEENGIKI
jgi:hypothetical protein